jgi:multisubunit Na+/H+ antiporter MnhC subunit
MLDVAIGLLGVFLLVLTFWDLFETVVVPRPTPGYFRIGRYIVRPLWRLVRSFRNGRDGRPHDRLLGLFAPAATILLLVAWLTTLIIGYGLVMYALRGQLDPAPTSIGTAVYFAATSLLTIGFGDIVAVDTLARAVIVTAAVSGLGVVALVVTFLFSLYASYQRREVEVVQLQAAAGAPPSAVALLESYANLGLMHRLPDFFVEWERWAVQVLDSHVAYPLLGYFRSSHDNLSWISALGTALDAASLILTTIQEVPRGEAKLFKRVGTHLVEDISNLGFAMETGGGLERADFEAACDRLEAAGYCLARREAAWPAFEMARSTYAARLEGMAAYWATPANQWLGDPVELRQPLHETADP